MPATKKDGSVNKPLPTRPTPQRGAANGPSSSRSSPREGSLAKRSLTKASSREPSPVKRDATPVNQSNSIQPPFTESSPIEPSSTSLLSTTRSPRSPLLIPELLGMILLQLPPHQILLMTQVCRAWKTAIDETPDIQKYLMFAPTSPEVVTPDRITKVFGSPTPDYDQTLKMNLLLRHKAHDWKCPQARTLWTVDVFEHTMRRDKSRVSWWRDEPAEPTERRAKSSWRRMFISDPPCTTVLCCIESRFSEDEMNRLEFKIERVEGLTLGFTEDVVQTALEIGWEHELSVFQGVRLHIYLDLLMTKRSHR